MQLRKLHSLAAATLLVVVGVGCAS